MSAPVLDLMRNLFETNLLGSTLLFAFFIIAFLFVFVLVAKVSFRIALILVVPAILAIVGGIVGDGLLGIDYRFIGFLVIIAIAVGGLALLWY